MFLFFFFFKQKTAYEMRISDWSSDVCSSDLIAAEANVQGLSATIRVTGTGLRPEITFASIPALPEDEVLSRLLFGTSVANLSAPEALQLAAAAASLRSGGRSAGNPLNKLGRAIGVDRIDRKSTRLNSSHQCASPVP